MTDMERMTVEQALERVQAGLNELPWRDHEAEMALATLRAELDGLLADAERYRWLVENHSTSYAMESDTPAEHCIYWEWQQATPNEADWSLQTALDAARQEKGHE